MFREMRPYLAAAVRPLRRGGAEPVAPGENRDPVGIRERRAASRCSCPPPPARARGASSPRGSPSTDRRQRPERAQRSTGEGGTTSPPSKTSTPCRAASARATFGGRETSQTSVPGESSRGSTSVASELVATSTTSAAASAARRSVVQASQGAPPTPARGRVAPASHRIALWSRPAPSAGCAACPASAARSSASTRARSRGAKGLAALPTSVTRPARRASMIAASRPIAPEAPITTTCACPRSSPVARATASRLSTAATVVSVLPLVIAGPRP
jgi:hypothetical protein